MPHTCSLSREREIGAAARRLAVAGSDPADDNAELEDADDDEIAVADDDIEPVDGVCDDKLRALVTVSSTVCLGERASSGR
jgi:hypothetical protein